jgi:hypothetical protein
MILSNLRLNNNHSTILILGEEFKDKKNLNYINIIVAKTGLNPERKIKSLNAQEFEKFWRAIEETENWVVGREDPIPRWFITGIHMKYGVIYEYQIQQNGKSMWISKQDAILLAQEWKLHAILVHCSNGRMYLRPESHGKAFHEMVCC